MIESVVVIILRKIGRVMACFQVYDLLYSITNRIFCASGQVFHDFDSFMVGKSQLMSFVAFVDC